MLSPTWNVDVQGFPLCWLWSLVRAVGAHILPSVTACHVPEGEVADKDTIPLLQRGGEGLTLPFPDQRAVPIAQEGEGAVEAKDKLSISGFNMQPAAPRRYLQQTWERREMRPLKSKEKHAGAQLHANVVPSFTMKNNLPGFVLLGVATHH